jgi:hypothetical protein
VPVTSRRPRRRSCTSDRRSTTTTRSTRAGIKFDVLEPFKRLDGRTPGKVAVLDDPLEMADPKKAFHR